MMRCLLLCCCLLSLGGLLPACQQVRRLAGHRYHETRSRAIARAELVGGTEIDTGRYLVLAYERFSNRPHHSDNWLSENAFIQLRSLADLPIHQVVTLPQAGVSVAMYDQATWYFYASSTVTGTITRLASSNAGHRLRLQLRYTDAKGQVQPLLAGTLFFRNDSTYFQRHHPDYHGKYDDLRLALKEPAKVKSLDLTQYAINYQKRNNHREAPDTLYRRLGELYNLESLNLHLSHLEVLPAGIEKLRRLKTLNLGYNRLASFPMQLLALDSLRELNLEWNQLDSIPAAVSGFRQLRVLHLGDNRLHHYPMAVNHIPGLQELSLANANLRTVPAQIAQLADLRVLNLDGFWNNPRRNQLLDVSALEQLPHLRGLSLRDNGTLPQLLPQLYRLPALEELNLQNNAADSSALEKSRFVRLKQLIR